ncbi:hypothetical protein HYQ46_010525 [Verticillium longisporum]|nr:hypothetical protein HYQ46_010525 [Verticillium longisporum]
MQDKACQLRAQSVLLQTSSARSSRATTQIQPVGPGSFQVPTHSKSEARLAPAAPATAMAPLPPPSLHPLHRRSADGGRIAGLFIGTLVGAVVTLALLYACFNCVFSPKTPTKAITGKGPCFLFPPNACALARAVPPAGEHAQGARKEV